MKIGFSFFYFKKIIFLLFFPPSIRVCHKTLIGFYLQVQIARLTKGQGSKRPRSEGIAEFMIVNTIPKGLWTDMGNHEQKRVKEHLVHLVHLMEIEPIRYVIEALIYFWAPKYNVFSISDV